MATSINRAPFHEGGRPVSRSTLTAEDHRYSQRLGANYFVIFSLNLDQYSLLWTLDNIST